jgi:SAM-dependent methyltransferase
VREAESRKAPEESLRLIDGIVARIRPDDPSLEAWFAAYAGRHRSRLAADLRLVERHVAPGARVLECGAVPPVLTAALAARGYRVSAVDLRPDRFATAIRELALDVVRCDVERERVPFADAAFDAVLFNEIFEHLRIDPIATLREVHRVLAPAGRLLLSTPNLRSLRGLRQLLVHNRGHAVSGDVYDQYEKLQTLGHMGHVREYTTREVEEFLSRLGFRVETTVFRGGHGRGLVGLAERLLPLLRPFFSVVAAKAPAPAVERG